MITKMTWNAAVSADTGRQIMSGDDAEESTMNETQTPGMWKYPVPAMDTRTKCFADDFPKMSSICPGTGELSTESRARSALILKSPADARSAEIAERNRLLVLDAGIIIILFAVAALVLVIDRWVNKYGGIFDAES